MTYATIVYIIDEEDGSTLTSTKTNELPADMTPPATNAEGTHIDVVTLETEKGKSTTITVTYPTQLEKYGLDYHWTGVLPTTDALGEFTCSTADLGPDEPTIELVGWTATVTVESTATPNPTDEKGLFRTLWQYACKEGGGLANPPQANLNDGALQYCRTNEAVCGAAALATVEFLTEVSTSTKKKSLATPTSSSKPASKASITPEPVSKPELDSSSTKTTSARSTKGSESASTEHEGEPSRSSTPKSTSRKDSTIIVVSQPKPTPSREAIAGEPPSRTDSPAITATETVAQLIVSYDETIRETLATYSEPVTITENNIVYVVEPTATADDGEDPLATSTDGIGNAIANGIGMSGGGSGSSSTGTGTGAAQATGSATMLEAMSTLLGLLAVGLVLVAL